MLFGDKIFDKVTELLEEGIDRLENGPTFSQLEKEQPEHASWVVFDVSLKQYATDMTSSIQYDDAQSMQNAIISLIQAVWTPQLLDCVRSGEIEDLTLRIGPRPLSGGNLNDDNGIEISTKQTE